MQKESFDEKGYKDFKELCKDYEQVVFLAKREDGNAIVSINCCPKDFLNLFDVCLTQFLQKAKEEDCYKEMRDAVRMAIVHAELKTEFPKIFQDSKTEKKSEKAEFASDMMKLLFKSLLENDDDDDD